MDTRYGPAALPPTPRAASYTDGAAGISASAQPDLYTYGDPAHKHAVTQAGSTSYS